MIDTTDKQTRYREIHKRSQMNTTISNKSIEQLNQYLLTTGKKKFKAIEESIDLLVNSESIDTPKNDEFINLQKENKMLKAKVQLYEQKFEEHFTCTKFLKLFPKEVLDKL